jgi:hypothetical protein
MENKINIAEILKDKPQGTKLYSSACGKCNLVSVDDKSFKISFYNSKFGFMNGGEGYLDKNGKLYDDGECIIFPSKEMRDWSKFAWKKGDVLVSNDGGTEVIFDKWYDDTYTNFYSKHYLNSEDENNIKYNEAFLCTTERYSLEDKDTAQTYINTIEKRLGGKLNLDTLEIEKTQPEFKDGDIVALVVRKCTHIAIFQSRQEAYIGFHAVLCQNDELLLEEPFREDVGDIELRLATDSEKQQLFDALAKDGKAWDAEKKQVVDLKPKWTPKPFDRVITRNAADDVWTANFFSHMDSHGEYVTIACVGGYTYCLPYNEETAKLIGTTNNWEG